MVSNTVATLGLLLLADAPPPKPPPPLEFKGFVAPVRRVTVGSRAAGQVIEVLVGEGQGVKKGDVLARIDPAEQTLAARRAEARLDIAKERLVELQAGPRRELVLQALAEVEEAQEAVKLADGEVLRLK